MNEINTQAPQVTAFSNATTQKIISIIGLLLIVGLALALTGTAWAILGIILFIAGAWAIKKGLTEHPANPPTFGLLTKWEKPIIKNGKGEVVSGTTILANYFPFYIDSVKIDMSTVDKDFKMKILSDDNVQMDVTASLSFHPDPDDLIDYVQSQMTPGIIRQLDDILFREVQKSVREKKNMTWENLNRSGEVIAEDVFRHIFVLKDYQTTLSSSRKEQRALGIIVDKLQIKMMPSEKVVKNAEQRAVEKLQRDAELAEYETMEIAAEKRLGKYRENPELEKHVAEIRGERQIREGQSFRIETTGEGSALINSLILQAGNQKDNKNKKEK